MGLVGKEIMSIFMIFLMIGYVCLVYYAAKSFLSFYQEEIEMDALKTKESYHKYLLQEDKVLTEKKALEEKFRELFTLYDMTKEITKSFSEEDALHIFRQKLQQNVVFEDCRLLDPLSKEINDAKKDPQYIFFPLKGKKELLGYVVIKGAGGQEHDKITILVNQFALVLRRISLYKEVERLAITDSLTQVFTRRYIMERFEEELDRARTKGSELAFLMLDVDFFKQVNDRHGHLVGDGVLRAVARCILENVREIDILGRYGGEEFCIILPDTDSAGAEYVAQRMRKAIENHAVDVYDIRIKVTASIGIAMFPRNGKKTGTLIDKADWALYRAKKMGRNRVCIFGMYDE